MDEHAVDDLLDGAGFGWFQLRLCVLCGMGYFAVCSELLSMVMVQVGVMGTFQIESKLTYSWLVFGSNLASFFGALVVGKSCDVIGRKIPFIVCIAISSVFGLACAFAPTFASLIVFRSIVGFGLGGLTVVDYIVLVESCPRNWRNFCTQVVFVAGCLGVVYIAILGFFPIETLFASIEKWRSMLFCGVLPLFATLLVRIAVSTDTLKYFAKCGNSLAVLSLVEEIRRVNLKAAKWCMYRAPRTGDMSAQPQLHEGVSTQPQEHSPARKLSHNHTEQALPLENTFSAMLKQAHSIPLATVWVVQSFVYWGLTIFLPRIFSAGGINPSVGLLCMGIAELPGVVIATMLAGKWSREIAICVCLCLSIVGALLTGTCLVYSLTNGVCVFGASIFYMFLIPVWGLLFVHTPESYPVKMRGIASGFHHACKSVPSVIAPFIAASILESSASNAFMFVWAALLCLGVVCSLWLVNLSNRHGNTTAKNVSSA